MKRIFNYIPQWIVSALRNKRCKKCETFISKKDIIAVGIRDHDGQQSLYIEHLCSNKGCAWRGIVNFQNKEASIEELCYMLLESAKNQKASERSRQIESKKNGGSITDKEVTEFLKFLNKNETHDEFLKAIKADQFQDIKDEQRKTKD